MNLLLFALLLLNFHRSVSDMKKLMVLFLISSWSRAPHLVNEFLETNPFAKNIRHSCLDIKNLKDV